MSLANTTLGHYQLLDQLGSGGTGTLYLAEDAHLSRRVAVKVVRIDDEFQQSRVDIQRMEKLFHEEMQPVMQLMHPSILPVFDLGQQEVDGCVYFYCVMEYCPAGSLMDWLSQPERADVRLSLSEIANLLLRAGEALDYAHMRGILHQDIKLSNVLLSPLSSQPAQPGRLPDLQLADFSVAHFFAATSSQGLSRSPYLRAASPYIAPEQWDGQPVPASDQYALAILAFYLLTGQFPFQGSLGQVIQQHQQTQPPVLSALHAQLDPSIDKIIKRALSKQPSERFPSVLAFAQAFAQAPQCSPDQPVLSSPVLLPLDIPRPLVQKQKPLRPWIRLISAALILSLILTCAMVVFQVKKPGGAPVIAQVSHKVTSATPVPIPTLTPTPTRAIVPTPTPAPKPTPTQARILTLTPTAIPTPVHDTIVDYLNDSSKIYSATSGLGFDQNNSQWMHGDASTLVRSTNSLENAVWKLAGMTSFQAVVYFWPPQSASPLSDLGVYVSADDVHWTAVTPTVNGGTGNWIVYTYTLSNLSHVNFVQMRWLTTATELWAEQVGQVTLSN